MSVSPEGGWSEVAWVTHSSGKHQPWDWPHRFFSDNTLNTTGEVLVVVFVPETGLWLFFYNGLSPQISQPTKPGIDGCGLEDERTKCTQAAFLVTLLVLVRSGVTVSGSRSRHRHAKSRRQILQHLLTSDACGKSVWPWRPLAVSSRIRVWLSQGDGYSLKGP